MPYALFEKNDRLTRPFRTEQEVWDAADRADLTVVDGNGEKTLDNNFEIKPCEAAPDEVVPPGQDQDIIFPERRTERRNAG